MAFNNICPGSTSLKSPMPEYTPCPNCGEEVEIWTDEIKTTCSNCKTTVFKDRKMSCIDWCQFAKDCFGEVEYNRIKGVAAPAGDPASMSDGGIAS
ncbi:MAG: hypothetical protein HY675_25850 [Chloroflexi bacterium]|nr:hypothetical protein [Chloroflexota bacterium]